MPTYLLTWNPGKFEWTGYAKSMHQVKETGSTDTRWSASGTKQIKEGDRLFLLRQGEEPRGIVASGFAKSDWFEGPHWDPDRTGETTTFVRIRIDRIIDLHAEPAEILGVDKLASLVPNLNTRIQRSGTLIDSDLAIAIEQLWQSERRLKMTRHNQIPGEISHADVMEAINYIDLNGIPPTFSASTGYDLQHDGKAYPPKPVIGLAARRVRGRMLFSQEFYGGENTPCLNCLEGLGFGVNEKQVRPVPFVPGEQYTRSQIQEAIGEPVSKGGNWATGHHRVGNDTFLFPTIGNPGSTGHDYNNYWDGDELYWETKGTLTQSNESVQALLNPPGDGRVYIFTREETRSPFTYEGIGRPAHVEGEKPVKVVWQLSGEGGFTGCNPPEEVAPGVEYSEGATKQVMVNIYERNPHARRACIEHYGCQCFACGFDFEKTFGDAGRGFIHVHHLKPLSDVGEEYSLDPIRDLRPVCPNCHGIIHRVNPPRTIEAVVAFLSLTKTDH